MEKLVSDLLNEFNFYGHIIFQIIEDKEGLLHIVECNPRFGGASTLAIAAGLDSFYWFLLESQGENINNHLFVRSTGEKRQIRAMADLVISV
jgi:carbamoyl-phosphate synthase large subunit